ncbi:MAG: 2-oxo acid dehydrogenase subunit E2 [Anaerolineales bacterium]|nr:2-oxo acid dehydrogenase subunit E2 [Anaerolineales bacterium]
MASEVFMPRLTHDMTSGRLLHWLKKEGDLVSIGETLFEVETDKAVSEVQAEASGLLQKIAFQEEQDVPVGAVMALIIAYGEELPVSAKGILGKSIFPPSQDNRRVQEQNQNRDVAQRESPPERRVFITPIARKLAIENNIDLNLLKGSGPRGKIVEADVRAWIAQRNELASVAYTPVEDMAYEIIPLTDIQRITGQRMTQSATTIPQFTLEVDVNMAEASRLRNFLSSQLGVKISFTTLITDATAKALHLHPRLNATYVEGEIRCYKSINIAVATATGQGLLAPVIHDADTLTLAQIQERINYFQSHSDGKSFSIEDLSHATFTLSNLGMYSIDRFTALINPPQAAILAVGKICEQVTMKTDKPLIYPLMTLRLSIDHRILDGATAAPFLMDVKEILETTR